MESARRYRTIHSLCRGSGGLLVALAAAIALLAPPALAWHADQAAWNAAFGAGAYSCSNCHTLNDLEGVVGTSYIAASSRTMPLIMAYNGSVPTNLGCTYCHSTPGNSKMKDALSHFGSKTSKHPVGTNWVSGAETNREYLTSASPNVTGTTDMDCVDCHDAALVVTAGSYVSHVTPIPATNPFLLRSVTAAEQYDNFCRGCHGTSAAAFKTQIVRVTSHADASAAVIEEDDGTDLKTGTGTNQCNKCHDSHYSGKVRLFNDGHEGDTAIVSTDCTTVCHENGDVNNNYDTHGHGRALSTYKYKAGVVDFTGNYISMDMACTSCHASLDTSDTSAARKPHVETPTGGTIQQNYTAKFNLDLAVQSFDTGSVYGNPASGVCYSCHATYETHAGTGGEVMGCQDCHDEHAEGSGVTSNYFMIPETAKKAGVYVVPPPRAKAGVEPINYDYPRRDPTTGLLNTGNIDFYNATATGVCDSTECHGAAGYAPLSTFATAHSGGAAAIATGQDCAGCHQHTGDSSGGFRATDSCSACHSYPGVSIAESDHVLSGAHARHVEDPPNGMGYACETCHFGYSHNQAGYVNDTNNWTNTTVPVTTINVRFNTSAGSINAGLTNLTYNAVEADAAAAPAVATHDGSCGLLLCHGNASPKQSDWTGAGETPAWSVADPAPLACNTCHAYPPATPAVNNAHGAHVTDAGYACADCHTAETATTHVNGTINIVASLSYSGGKVVGDFAYGTCTTGSCHNAVTNINWNVAQTTCNQCHQVLAADPEDNWVGNDRVASKVVQAEYTGYGHGNAAAALACADCHDMAVAHDFSAALNGGANPYRLGAGFTCSNTTTACHAPGTNGPVTGVDISTMVNHEKALMGTDGKRTWPWTPQCVNCHDPHGDGTNIAMIGNEIFDSAPLNLLAAPGAGVNAQNTALVFTDAATGQNTTGASYADSDSAWSGICQECHISAGTGMLSYLDGTNTSAGSHPGAVGGNPGDCSGCHPHAGAFKPSGCNGCHGGAGYWPDTVNTSRTAYPDRAGRHLTHMTVIGTRVGYGTVPSTYSGDQQKYVCLFCHNDTTGGAGGSGHYPSGYNKTDAPANVGSFNIMWGAYGDDANDSYTAATYNVDAWLAGSTCVGLDCHNSQTSPAGYEWYGAAVTLSCGNCHTPGGTNTTTVAHPSSGVHDAAATTGRTHDGDFFFGVNQATQGSCTTCHISGTSGPTNPASAHLNGSNEYSIGANDVALPEVFVAAGVGFTDAVVPTCRPVNSGATAGCHYEQWKHSPTKTWTRLWHESGAATDGTQCIGCHGNFTQWVAGMAPDHAANWDGQADGSEIGQHGGTGNYDKCATCHVYNAAAYLKAGETNNLGWAPSNTSTNHGDGNITMNSTLAYNQTTFQCGTNCHDANGTHAMADSGWAVNSIAGPGVACSTCHDGSGTGATTITNTSPHTIRTRSSTGATVDAADCTDCHPGGTRGTMHQKGGLADVIAIPNNSSASINYTHLVDTGVNGFVLGGDYTSGTTEADICWNCHANNDDGTGFNPQGQEVSEWGTNTDTNDTAANYNFGTLSTRSWFTATWSSANFKYKRGRLTTAPTTSATPSAPGSKAANTGSTHSANPTAGVQGVDTAENIRCSYCHAVHTGQNGSGVAGKPYLRGTWKGNPYREDGAPRWDTGYDLHSYAARANFGPVPRGNTAATEYGGFQIDQNNATPASGWNYATMGGLCQNCHGTDLTTLNKFGTNGAGWAADLITSGRNSHGVIVAPGSATNAVNLLSEARRHTSAAPYPSAGGQANGSFRTAPWMAVKHLGTNGGYTFRGTSGYKFLPTLTNSRPYGGSGYNWGATVDNGSVNTLYHKFSCSKCHNPHASRLPRLLITNCLDTAANTWEDRYSAAASGYSNENNGVRTSQLTTAQNCHRRRDPAYNKTWAGGPGTPGASPRTSVPDGWNTVSPW